MKNNYGTDVVNTYIQVNHPKCIVNGSLIIEETNIEAFRALVSDFNSDSFKNFEKNEYEAVMSEIPF